MSATLTKSLLKPARQARRKQTVDTIKITLFRRVDSSLWQARIRFGKQLVRVSTGAFMPASAAEFAELAYRHYAAALKRTGKLPKGGLHP